MCLADDIIGYIESIYIALGYNEVASNGINVSLLFLIISNYFSVSFYYLSKLTSYNPYETKWGI